MKGDITLKTLLVQEITKRQIRVLRKNELETLTEKTDKEGHEERSFSWI